MFLYGGQLCREPRFYRDSVLDATAGQKRNSFFISAGKMTEKPYINQSAVPAQAKNHAVWSAECRKRLLSGCLRTSSVLLRCKSDTCMLHPALSMAEYLASPAALPSCPLNPFHSGNAPTPDRFSDILLHFTVAHSRFTQLSKIPKFSPFKDNSTPNTCFFPMPLKAKSAPFILNDISKHRPVNFLRTFSGEGRL